MAKRGGKKTPPTPKSKEPKTQVDTKKGTDDLTTGADAKAIEKQMAALKEGKLVENPKLNDQEKKPEHKSVTMSPDYQDVKTNPFYVMNLHQQRHFAHQIGVMKWQILKGNALIAAIKKKVLADGLDLFAEAVTSVGCDGSLEGFKHKLAEDELITNPKNAVMSHAKGAPE